MSRRRRNSESLLRWFGLEPSDYLNDESEWIRRENGLYRLEGLYVTPLARPVALDWEQPSEIALLPIEDRIPCFVCGLIPYNFYNRGGYHQAWVLLECKLCKQRWYCASDRQRPECPKCLP